MEDSLSKWGVYSNWWLTEHTKERDITAASDTLAKVSFFKSGKKLVEAAIENASSSSRRYYVGAT